MRTLGILGILLACSVFVPAQASPYKVKKLAKKTGVPLDLLKELKAERYFARDVYVRRQFIKDLAFKARKELLPLVVFIGISETKDESIRRSCIRLYSHMGLLEDKKEIRRLIFPAVRKALSYGSKRGQDQRWSFEELVRLSRWFQLDAELAEMLVPVFNGKDFNLRSLAFKALRTVRHEKLSKEIIVPACQLVYGSTKGYSLFDRFAAVDELKERDIGLIAPLLREAMLGGKDPKMQLKSMYTFRDWKDPSVLPLAQKIDKTAVHKLRRAAFRVRTALGDKSAILYLAQGLEKDHIDFIATCLEDIGEIDDPKAEALLYNAYSLKAYPKARANNWERKGQAKAVLEEQRKMKLAASVGLVRMGKWKSKKFLQNVIEGKEEAFDDKARLRLCKKLFWIETEQANALIACMVTLKNEAFADIRKRAVIAVGERRVKSAIKDLSDMYWDKANWGHLKFHAGVSLVELDAKKALQQLEWYLPKYEDDIVRLDFRKFVLGQLTFNLSRWNGSGYIEALEKFERTKDKRMLPLILTMMKPVAVGAAGVKPDPKAAKKKKRTSSTKERKKGKELDDGQPKGPEPVYRAKNQFVRAKAVEVAALIGGIEAKDVLAKAVDDYRSVVRQAGVRAVGKVSGLFDLPIGATLAEECEARPKALSWLAEQGVRKLE